MLSLASISRDGEAARRGPPMLPLWFTCGSPALWLWCYVYCVCRFLASPRRLGVGWTTGEISGPG
ncbi:hypothetical protein IAD21_00663 [Abditibacteriota bacterium]|nr:hypothetical protein IAD21_00663 [Abditibacteriota bacterium]